MNNEKTWRIPTGDLQKVMIAEQNLDKAGIHLDADYDSEHYRIWHLHRGVNTAVEDRVDEVAKRLGCRNPISEIVYNQNLVTVNGPKMIFDGHTKNIMTKIFDLNGQ